MRHLLPLAAVLLLAACAPAETEPTEAAEPAEPSEAAEVLSPAAAAAWATREALAAEVPELAACNEAFREEGASIFLDPIRHDDGSAIVIEVPCGDPPGTGAYGYPLSLVAEYPAMNSASDGPLERHIEAIPLVERAPTGEFENVGFITQAHVLTDDLNNGYLHLFYPGGSAGSCGVLLTYEQVSYRSPFEFFGEARARTCGEPCEGDNCADPRTWEMVSEGLTPQ